MKYIVLDKPYLFIESSIPEEWSDVKLVHHEKWKNFQINHEEDEFFVCNDNGYDTISKSNQVPSSKGFSKSLSQLTNDKYQSREKMMTMSSIPYVLCENNVVDWPYEKTDRLFAKPVSGTAARGTVRGVRHGTHLPDIGEPYLIEKYIDDVYPRLSVDGYVCNDQIGILTTCDNIYLPTEEIKFHYLGYPSRFWNNQLLHQRYTEIVRELKHLTNCDNQIIDIEFFAVDGDFIPMEINPRILFNAVPLYEKVSGVNPWKFMSNLLQGIVIDFPKCPPKTGVVRYSYDLREHPVYIKHEKDIFSIHLSDYSHTYATCDVSKPHWELIKEIDEFIPVRYPNEISRPA